MAKNNNEEAAPAETPATEAPAAAATEDSRHIILNVPEGDPVTLLAEGALSAGPQKRADYIRALAKTGEWERGAIAKHVSVLQGKKVAYQIVFQATKGIPNVKASPRGEAAPAEAPAAE